MKITENIKTARFDSLRSGSFFLLSGYLCFIGETPNGLLSFDITDGKYMSVKPEDIVEPVSDLELLVPFPLDKMRN